MGNFNFTNYPEILDKYKRYTRLYNKFFNACEKNADNIEECEARMDEYMCNELAKTIYNTIGKEKPSVLVHFGKEKGLAKKWDEVFPKNFDNLDKEQRMCLCGLVDGNYNYILPKEYYLEHTSFQEL